MEFLFNDDWLDRVENVRRVLGRPVRSETPVLSPERPWESAGIMGSQALFYDDEDSTFKLWYRSMAHANPRASRPGAPAKHGVNPEAEDWTAGLRHFICYAVSEDGVHWHRPDLGLVEFGGSRRNNILRETTAGDAMFFNVVKDPHDPDPARRYKAIGFDRGVPASAAVGQTAGYGLCVGYSSDGLRWPEVPRLVMSADEVTDCDCVCPRRDPDTGLWTGFWRPRTYPKRRLIGFSTSSDWERWTAPRMLMTPAAGDDPHVEFYGLTANLFAGWRIGLLWVFYNHPDRSPVTAELVCSRDGRDYRRPMPGQAMLTTGPSGSFDSRLVCPMTCVERGGECFLFYSGTNVYHGSDRDMPMQRNLLPEGGIRQTGIGLARLPWGQWCGLRADNDGVVETRCLCRYHSTDITAAAEVAAGGEICAEILDQFGRPLPGWAAADCRLRRTDAGRLAFAWGPDGCAGLPGQKSAAGGVIGHVIKLRFYLRKAALFAFEAS